MTLQESEENETADIEQILRRPGAKEMYLETKRQAWIWPFLEVRSPILRRLGAKLLVSDLVVRLAPHLADVEVAEDAKLARQEIRAARRIVRQAAGKLATKDLAFYCDEMRHLVCVPYTKTNLHRMARALDLNPNDYHRRGSHPHYDIPKRRYLEIARRCTVIRPRELLVICKGGAPPDTSIPDLEWAST